MDRREFLKFAGSTTITVASPIVILPAKEKTPVFKGETPKYQKFLPGQIARDQGGNIYKILAINAGHVVIINVKTGLDQTVKLKTARETLFIVGSAYDGGS